MPAAGCRIPATHLAEIMKVCGDEIVGSSVSVHVPAMLGIDFNGQLITRHVNFVGLDPETYDKVSHFGRYLLHPENQSRKSAFSCARKVTHPTANSFRRRVGDIAEHVLPTNERSKKERARIKALQAPIESDTERNRSVDRISAPSELLAESDGDISDRI